MGKRQTVAVLAATRLHFPEGTTAIPEVTVKSLQNFARSTQELGIAAAVAVNSLQADVESILRGAAPRLEFKVLHVPVWGAFVHALNTLLGEAQARGDHYILYQSLEVCCARPVLKRLLDHFTKDTLVVGPVLDGHVFEEGEQPLNGRSAPWNTLALWKVRKLGLTGFLSIADGMPQARRASIARQMTGDPEGDQDGDLWEPTRQFSGDVLPHRRQSTEEEDLDFDDGLTMGTNRWWHGDGSNMQGSMGMFARQQTEVGLAIPAGVEEVTAIALLQHLLGAHRARAVLVNLPPDLESLMSWEAKWAGDERRKAWHEYKMASKVARPAAQIRQLFGGKRRWQVPLLKPLLGVGVAATNGMTPPNTPGGAAQQDKDELNFGVVFHFSDSVRPALQVEAICLAAVALFSVNFASIFASALRTVNSPLAQASVPEVLLVSLLLSGVYLPMPVSLWLTRSVVSFFDHVAGLALFATLMLLSHCMIIAWEVNGQVGTVQYVVLVASRLVAGLGSGVLFQARFVLASLSTMDHHTDLQERQLLASDLGHGIGALLPWMASAFSGSSELSERRPEFWNSVLLAMLNLALLIWILAAFPKSLHRLPDRIRFLASGAASTLPSSPSRAAHRVGWSSSDDVEGGRDDAGGSQRSAAAPTLPVSPSRAVDRMSSWHSSDELEALQSESEVNRWRGKLLFSATARVFVQSSAIMTLALWMRDANMTGSFRQTKAIALFFFLPAPFQAVASGVCPMPFSCPAWLPSLEERGKEVVVVMVATVMAVFICTSLTRGANESPVVLTCVAVVELAALLIALAIATPLSASRLNELKDAEQSTVKLEWLKAYVGRIFGPIFSLVVQNWLGYDPLLVILCLATVLVAVTA